MGVLLKNLHYIILAYSAYSGWVLWEELEIQVQEKEQSIKTVKRNVKKAKRELSEIKKFKSEYDKRNEQINEVKKQIEELKTKLPSEDQQPIVLKELREELIDLNLKQVNINQTEVKQDGEVYIANGIKISGEGTYLQFLVFMERLWESQRLYDISNVELKNMDQRKRGRFHVINSSITVQTYQFNENYSPVAEEDIELSIPNDKKNGKKI